MTTTRQYDFLNRLQSISSSPSSSSSSSISFGYVYNDANQRTRRTEADGSYWVYQYDALGQVTSGRKYWADGSPVPGQQFEYGFDDIGNRTSTKAGGDANGANLRPAVGELHAHTDEHLLQPDGDRGGGRGRVGELPGQRDGEQLARRLPARGVKVSAPNGP